MFFFEPCKFFLAGYTEGGNTDTDILNLLKGITAADKSSTGGENIIDQKDMTSFEFFWMLDAKSALNIPFTFGGTGEALLIGVAMTDKSFGVHFSIHHLRDTTAEQFTLIVTTFESAIPMEGHRHQYVDVVETCGMQEFQSHLTSHHKTEVTVVMELHGMD